MSTLRRYAQRNNNVTKIVPEYVGLLPDTNITDCVVYSLTIPKSQFVGGIYVVDLSGVDASGNLLNVDGRFSEVTVESEFTIHTVAFVVNIPTPADIYPGLEFTLFFKNPPIDRLIDNPFLTIGLVSPTVDFIPVPYIMSPPFPPLAAPTSSSSVTFKSDGTNFNVVSSGPAGWLGVPALSAILAAYQTLPP
jgi:hypothetical protein